MWVSALSLNKKQSSTYNKYACGCFLYAPRIFRTAKDGSGFIQERDLCYAQISSLSSCTRMYNCLTGCSTSQAKAAWMPLFKNVRPCTFLNYEFFYRKTRFCLETLTSCQQQRRLRRSRNSPSIRTRMSVVPHRSDVFCLSKKLDAQQNIRMYFVG